MPICIYSLNQFELLTMAASYTSPALTASASTPSGRTITQTAPKLRDSCHACAASKLKCYKEKPTCSRCAKRGITCEYVAVKRAGRKPSRPSTDSNRENSTSNPATNANHKDQSTPEGNQISYQSAVSSTAPQPSPGVVQLSPRPGTSGSLDIISNLFSPSEDQALSSTNIELNDSFDDFFASPMSFSMPDMIDVDVLGQAGYISTGMDQSDNTSETLFDPFPLFEDAVSELMALSGSNSPKPEMHNFSDVGTTDPRGTCLAQALGLMKELSPEPSNNCASSVTQSLENPTGISTIQAVLAKNEAAIQAVSAMLKCSCSQDGYLLTILSLIVFKILGGYAAAARKASPQHGSNGIPVPQTHSRQSSHSEQALQDSTVVGGYSRNGYDSARMAAQLVLSELHHVHRLVNQLSSRLNIQALDRNVERADTPNSMDFSGNAESEITVQLSAVMLDQLDFDLKKRMKGLSFEILEKLRRL
ncbi:putative C6 transcription factor [Xylogone sp. PMI_703]|nr:putative C6 transcription factor [Xylogone sp. PMI_703]